MVRADEDEGNSHENAAIRYEHIDWTVEIDWVARVFVQCLRAIVDSATQRSVVLSYDVLGHFTGADLAQHNYAWPMPS